MITDAIIGGLLTVLRGVVSLMPEFTPDTSLWQTSGQTFGEQAFWLNGYWPVTTTVAVLVAVLAFWAAATAWSTLTHLWQQLPFT